ncbi:hypothetical protein ACFL1G_08155 [Planctomycetota bacterium]
MMRIRVDRRFKIARLWSNREMTKLAPLFSGDVVNVSAWDDRDKEGRHYKDYFCMATNYYYTNYTGTRGFQQRENEYFVDLANDLPEELRGRFDVAFNHTTLEHIFDVQKAFANLCNMSKDAVIIVVPFSQVQHEADSYKDYWRFTPSCMRKMFQKNGLEVIYEAESKAKNAAIYLLFVGSRHPERWRDKMPKYDPIQEVGRWIGLTWASRIHFIRKLRRLIS